MTAGGRDTEALNQSPLSCKAAARKDDNTGLWIVLWGIGSGRGVCRWEKQELCFLQIMIFIDILPRIDRPRLVEPLCCQLPEIREAGGKAAFFVSVGAKCPVQMIVCDKCPEIIPVIPKRGVFHQLLYCGFFPDGYLSFHFRFLPSLLLRC